VPKRFAGVPAYGEEVEVEKPRFAKGKGARDLGVKALPWPASFSPGMAKVTISG
jgi:hypothetical protein